MAQSRNQDFLRGSDRAQRVTVLLAAGAVIAVAVVAVLAFGWIRPRYAQPDGLPVSIEVPYVGPGVTEGTAVISRGARIGAVVSVDATGRHTLRLRIELSRDRVNGLTDSFDLDYRPQNYFGITAVNLVSRPGGAPLTGPRSLTRMPAGDFTMSTMLEQGSLVIDGTLTDSMIATLNKVIRYTDGLTPLLETGVLVADRVAVTQRALPSDLLAAADDVLAVLPGFSTQTIQALYNMFDTEFNSTADGGYRVDDEAMDQADAGLYLAANNLFGSLGRLLASHRHELEPTAGLVATVANTVPHLLDDGAALDELSVLVDRYDAAFTGTGEQRRLRVRLVLDDLPALATPLARLGLPAESEAPR
ncbi:Mce family protein [Nocardia bovistercoris]|uniref:Mce family protein n=1 Tax=Nocardia bovistercoris TaxID=2785916 RepID=A0A931IBB0_9NOCA|nr:Mce family protein [Nocardia bovistercoris]MBH0776710.1 Mce family protein [Nocardia bovistercoris]